MGRTGLFVFPMRKQEDDVDDLFKRKGISLSSKVYFIDALSYMALGLFATLVVGLILKTAGGLLSLPLIIKMGTLAMGLMGPAIGVAVAYRLHASPLIIFASVVSGAAGAELGGLLEALPQH